MYNAEDKIEQELFYFNNILKVRVPDIHEIQKQSSLMFGLIFLSCYRIIEGNVQGGSDFIY